MNLPLELGIGNGARPCNYTIDIQFPSELGSSFIGGKYLETLIKSATMPGSKLNTRDFWLDGHRIKLPGAMEQDQVWTATFYLDDDYYARTKMEAWMFLLDGYFLRSKPPSGSLLEAGASFAMDMFSKALDFFKGAKPGAVTSDATSATSPNFIEKLLAKEGFGSGAKLAFDKTRQATVTITQKSYTGGDIMSCVMYNAFPIEISAINFDDANIDSISEFTVTFAYSHHELKKPAGIVDYVKKLF